MIINSTLANHSIITQSLSRLSLALIRHNNPYHEPVNTDLLEMFVDLNQRNTESDISAIAKLDVSGDLSKVAEELYNPSSDLFDTEGYTAYFAPVELPPGIETSVEFSGSNDISCASCYLIKYNDEVVVIVKNYHFLNVIDNSQTSWNYPLLLSESISSQPNVYGGRLGSPYIIESLDVSPSFYSAAFPFEYIYTTYNYGVEALDSSPTLQSMAFPISVIYTTYDSGIDAMDTTPNMYSMAFPLIVGYITYTTEIEAVDSSGQIYALFFN